MNLQEKWISSFENQEDALQKERQQAIAIVKAKGFPTRKDEAWKYTSVAQIVEKDFSLAQTLLKSVEKEQITTLFFQEDSYKIVFVNGKFESNFSRIETGEIKISSLSEILKSSDYQCFIENNFNKETQKEDVFTALNTAFFTEGVAISIPKGKTIEKPIEILHVITSSEKEICNFPRNMIILGEHSEVKIIETHHSFSKKEVLTDVVTEIFVGKSAILDYYKVQNDSTLASLIDNTYISQEAKSNASVHTFSLSGGLVRNNLNFFHHGEYLESTLKGVSILDGNQHTDHYTFVHHAQPNCESHQDYKSVLFDEATNVFNGKILVDKIAQKTNAYQQNDNVLLSKKATVYTKPQLEIFADDVKCSHGCTVGEMDSDALFYLQSRGIPKKEGQALLTYAFAHSVLESVKIQSLKKEIESKIAKKLGVNIDFL